MKKSITGICILLLGAAYLIFASMHHISDEALQKKWMVQVIEGIESGDPTTLKLLFSDDVKCCAEFDEQIISLLDFFEGEIVSYDVVLGMTHLSTHKGIVTTEVGCDIETTSNSYRMAIRVCLLDRSKKVNEGIQSLFVIESDNIPENLGYWGSISWGVGITIADREG